MEIGNNKSKYAIHVHVSTCASKYAGTIYCNSEEEYEQLLGENFDELHEKGHFSTNISNDFEVGDIEIDEFNFTEEAEYCENVQHEEEN
jgi:hypothetical protein